MEHIVFLSQYRLYLGFFVILRYIYRFLFRANSGRKTQFFSELKKAYKRSHRISYVRHILTLGSIVLFFVILADPHTTLDEQKQTQTGIDIVIALDVSNSMLANDFSPNRFEVAKEVLIDFVAQLQSDRLGLVVFAGKPFTSVPLTFDYNFVSEIVGEMGTDIINQNLRGLQGTAIGDALLNALSVLEKGLLPSQEGLFPSQEGLFPSQEGLFPSQAGQDIVAREQVIVLITDGESTPQTLDPIVVSQLASEQNIRVYTVGIGSEAGGFIVYDTPFGPQKQQVAGVDEVTLKKIAEITNANYRRATDEQTFQTIFDQLSTLSKSEVEISTTVQHTPIWHMFGWGLLICLIFLGVIQWHTER